MDITTKIRELTEKKESIEAQIKDLKKEITDINTKCRKLQTIVKHANEVLTGDPGEDPLYEISDVPHETSANGSA